MCLISPISLIIFSLPHFIVAWTITPSLFSKVFSKYSLCISVLVEASFDRKCREKKGGSRNDFPFGYVGERRGNLMAGSQSGYFTLKWGSSIFRANSRKGNRNWLEFFFFLFLLEVCYFSCSDIQSIEELFFAFYFCNQCSTNHLKQRFLTFST